MNRPVVTCRVWVNPVPTIAADNVLFRSPDATVVNVPNEGLPDPALVAAGGNGDGPGIKRVVEHHTTILAAGDVHMTRDAYKNEGQAISMGPNTKISQSTFAQTWLDLRGSVDLATLADELRLLGAAMRDRALTASESTAIEEVSAAEKAARNNEGPKVLEHLKAAGSWALNVARDIGVRVAAVLIASALAVPHRTS